MGISQQTKVRGKPLQGYSNNIQQQPAGCIAAFTNFESLTLKHHSYCLGV